MNRQSGLSHALKLLKIISSGSKTFSQLKAEMDDLAAPTLSRLLKKLANEKWLSHDDGPLYEAGEELLLLARKLNAKAPHIALMKMIVKEMALESGQTAAYVEWEHGSFCFKAKHEMPDSYHHIEIGGRHGNPMKNGFAHVFFPSLASEEQTRLKSGLSDDELTRLQEEDAQLQATKMLVYKDIGLRFMAPVFQDGQILGVLGLSTLQMNPELTTYKNLSECILKYSQIVALRLEQ